MGTPLWLRTARGHRFARKNTTRERRFVKGKPEDTAFRRVERCEGSPLCRRQLRGDNALLLGAPPFAHDHRYSLLAKQ